MIADKLKEIRERTKKQLRFYSTDGAEDWSDCAQDQKTILTLCDVIELQAKALENSLHDDRCDMVHNLRNNCTCHKNTIAEVEEVLKDLK